MWSVLCDVPTIDLAHTSNKYVYICVRIERKFYPTIPGYSSSLRGLKQPVTPQPRSSAERKLHAGLPAHLLSLAFFSLRVFMGPFQKLEPLTVGWVFN